MIVNWAGQFSYLQKDLFKAYYIVWTLNSCCEWINIDWQLEGMCSSLYDSKNPPCAHEQHFETKIALCFSTFQTLDQGLECVSPADDS